MLLFFHESSVFAKFGGHLFATKGCDKTQKEAYR